MSFTYGDLVTINSQYDKKGKYAGKVFRIVKVPYKSNEVNYGLVPHGVGTSFTQVRARGYMLHPYVNDGSPTDVTLPPTVVTPTLPTLNPGTVVRYRHDGKLYIVTKQYGLGGYQLFPLGGGTKYWKHVPRENLVVIDPAALVSGDTDLVVHPAEM